MKKFIVLYHAPMSAMEQMQHATPEDMKKSMEAWMQWAQRCGSGLLDMGAPLGNAQKMTKMGGMPSQSTVGGYSILQAESMDEAKKMMEGHPHLEWTEGCEIEIHEAMPTPGM